MFWAFLVVVGFVVWLNRCRKRPKGGDGASLDVPCDLALVLTKGDGVSYPFLTPLGLHHEGETCDLGSTLLN